MKLLKDAPTQEEQLEYVRALRMLEGRLDAGTPQGLLHLVPQGRQLQGRVEFRQLPQAHQGRRGRNAHRWRKGGAQGDHQRQPRYDPSCQSSRRGRSSRRTSSTTLCQRSSKLKSGRDFDRGRKLFAAAKCFACHRYDNEGGSNGPDLTGVAGRFSPRDLLESVIDPSKEVSDQYQAVEIRTKDERIVIGRIVNLNADNVMVNTDMHESRLNCVGEPQRYRLMKPSKVSMMPAGLARHIQGG